ncbi:alpha/beta fold hydrolase [Bradyrhizobium sp. 190]|uniref:alpha/beta fold hydrolase n=1 Tax=Bradyrhizobium sp. 190 TaxID=2782658 RepID=UPI001FF71A5F|nr:alpha/beta fold hydrolase [Bradyrhizobium sp. 190]MCK1513235.1 alpha/beta fold hydrolase [Bradyrhizobium sp. 190]
MTFTALMLGVVAGLAFASVGAAAQSPPVQTCQLGDLALESGAVVPNFRMTYITHGTLGADKGNAILSLHGLRGTRDSQSLLAGPGKAFDTSTYFVVQPDTLGVASLDPNATTSPSRSGMNMKFPRFTIRDMVKAEHRMLTECLGIQHLIAVTGISMGGIGAMQWAVSFPDFMDAVIPIVPQAHATRQGNFIYEASRQAIMLDPKWRGGEYSADDRPRRGTGIGLNIQGAFAYSAEIFGEKFKDRAEVDNFFASTTEQIGAATEARDWVYRTWAITDHDIAKMPPFNGDLRAAARSIKARLLLMPNCYDQLHPPGESGAMEVAAHAPNAKIVDLDHISGHSGYAEPASIALIAAEVKDLLKRIVDKRPGFSGPRFPRHWTRADRCPG